MLSWRKAGKEVVFNLDMTKLILSYLDPIDTSSLVLCLSSRVGALYQECFKDYVETPLFQYFVCLCSDDTVEYRLLAHLSEYAPSSLALRMIQNTLDYARMYSFQHISFVRDLGYASMPQVKLNRTIAILNLILANAEEKGLLDDAEFRKINSGVNELQLQVVKEQLKTQTSFLGRACRSFFNMATTEDELYEQIKSVEENLSMCKA
ncbi:MAG: hypothetical protein ACE365_04690 [Gammaproteobacteria bacterium]